MSYFAGLVARGGGRWKATEVDLEPAKDIEGVAELMRSSAPGDDPVLLFVEADDEWLALVRLDGSDDARVFISDVRAVATSELAAVLFEDQLPEVLDADEPAPSRDDEEQSAAPEPEPGGATELLADLGVSGDDLLDLCSSVRMLPGDVISVLCERIGCADEYELLR